MGYQAWSNPDLQSISGLNTQVVFGENLQLALGTSHQIAVGNNFQICVNPGALAAKLGGPICASVTDFAGSGLGGNLQMCIGTNTNVTWGRQFNVIFGGDTVELKATEKDGLFKALCLVAGGLCVTLSIAYGACTDENWRANIVIIFQVAMGAVLVAMVVYGIFRKNADQTVTELMKDLFGAEDYKALDAGGWTMAIGAIVAVLANLTGAVFPVIAAGQEEGHFSAQQQPSAN